jgi:hypothetical protein
MTTGADAITVLSSSVAAASILHTHNLTSGLDSRGPLPSLENGVLEHHGRMDDDWLAQAALPGIQFQAPRARIG